jgi:hypothetical protein
MKINHEIVGTWFETNTIVVLVVRASDGGHLFDLTMQGDQSPRLFQNSAQGTPEE